MKVIRRIKLSFHLDHYTFYLAENTEPRLRNLSNQVLYKSLYFRKSSCFWTLGSILFIANDLVERSSSSSRASTFCLASSRSTMLDFNLAFEDVFLLSQRNRAKECFCMNKFDGRSERGSGLNPTRSLLCSITSASTSSNQHVRCALSSKRSILGGRSD